MLRRLLVFIPIVIPIVLLLLTGCADEDLVIEPRSPDASIERIEARLSPADSARFHEALEYVLRAHVPDSLYAAIDQPGPDPNLFASVFGKTPDEVIAMAHSLREGHTGARR